MNQASVSDQNSPRDLSGKRSRPKRTYRTGRVTRTVRALAGVLGVFTTAYALIAFRTLPEIIPTHFDATGQPDAWGNRSTILILVTIFTAIILAVMWSSFYPRVFNYPSNVTQYNAQTLYRKGEQMMVWCGLGCSLLYAGIVATTFFSVPLWPFLVTGLALTLGSVFVGLARMINV